MIVKNESKVIERCLNSLKDKIDYWVIIDTGSTDGTQDIIKKCMKGIKGELHERPWVNFAHNRNQALDIARSKADYILFIDADEALEFDADFNKDSLDKPYYRAVIIHPMDFSGLRTLLINSKHDWKWVGAIHETILCNEINVIENFVVKGVKLINFQDGFRSDDPEKYLKDAALLEKELEKDPENTRHQFYLAQSYLIGGQKVLALKNYEKRFAMGGAEDERWYSLYTMARLHEELNYPADLVNYELNFAYEARPTRAEPIWHLAKHHLNKGNYIVAYALAIQGLSLPKPEDIYFIENWIYDYGLLCTYADAARNLGFKNQAQLAYKTLLDKTTLPNDVRTSVEQVFKNMQN